MLTGDEIRILLSDIENERVERTLSTKDTDKYARAAPEGDVAVVEVQPSRITPVKYKGTTYIRIGARRGIANEEEDRILREKSEVKTATFDTTPCLQTSIDDLDLDLFKKEYLPKFVPETILKGDKREIKQQLASLQLFDTKHDCPTVAGILLIGEDPVHILFGSYIQYVKFAGKNRASKVLSELKHLEGKEFLSDLLIQTFV